LKISAYGATTEGKVREHNEDYFLVDEKNRLFVVADGMGGHAAGEVASRIAVETVAEMLSTGGPEQTWPYDHDPRLSHDANALARSIRVANRRVIEASRQDDRLRGMGTTLVALAAREDAQGKLLCYVGHVGDSRVYRVRPGRMDQLTSDHSWINSQVQSGAIDADTARRHPLRNVITRALGSEEDVDVDIIECEPREDDVFLLCSDGLNTMVEDHDIMALVHKHSRDLQAAAQALLDKANEGGGEDNCSVVLVRMDK
jgi:protein phosphatase